MPQMITAAKLASINLAVNTAYNKQYDTVESLYKRYCYETTSDAAGELYPRLDLLPGLREWIGDRIITQLSYSTFQINNRTFEQTIGVKREDVEDDRFGILTPAAQLMAQNAANFPDLLAAALLLVGHTTPCYDGQNFFDVAHPDFDRTGTATTSSNYVTAQGGDTNGAPWFLLDTRQVLRAMIFQKRRPFVLTPRFSLTDPTVFEKNEFLWGTDGRCNAGFGIWQTAVMCTAPLNAKYFEIARTAMASHHRPDGSPLNIRPNLCMVPSTNLGPANSLFKGQYMDPSEAGGIIQSNRWMGACEVLENYWLN
jgi:phage major head subunit gpT-like protein